MAHKSDDTRLPDSFCWVVNEIEAGSYLICQNH
ncbi:MAG: hypothetical protein ACI8S6_003966 [Myxococcota bacterium]|jgi:hypothetical protein